MRWMLVALFLLSSSSAHACIPVPSDGQDKLIDWSSLIFLGKAISAEEIVAPLPPKNDDEVIERIYKPHLPLKYRFEVIKLIKGALPSDFYVAGKKVTEDKESSDFNSHMDELFWKQSGGRVSYENCVKKPSFEIGKTYLIFDGLKLNKKSYELIKIKEDGSSEDKWLEYVKRRVNQND